MMEEFLAMAPAWHLVWALPTAVILGLALASVWPCKGRIPEGQLFTPPVGVVMPEDHESMSAPTLPFDVVDNFEPEHRIFGEPTDDDMYLEGVDPDAYRDRLIEDGWL